MIARMVREAEAFLDMLAPVDRQRCAYEFEDLERRRFFYTPTDHGGIALSVLDPLQQRQGLRLLATGLSEPGYNSVAAIMGLENVLDHRENFRNQLQGRGRDPMRYYVSIFGTPGDRTWGWRVGGHHVSVNVTLVDDQVYSTPLFFGASPAVSPMMGGYLHRPLASVEDTARALLRSLNHDQRQRAVISGSAPSDVVSGIEPVVRAGLNAPALWAIFRDSFSPEIIEQMKRADEALNETLGTTEQTRSDVSLAVAPKGLSAAAMTSEQRELLAEVMTQYVGRLPDELANAWSARLPQLDSTELSFAWAGGAEPGEPHYYRVQGTRVLMEYDNTQNDVNHVHAVLRDPLDDFGSDALAAHYAQDH